MMYLLDFSDTLFDYDAFKAYQGKRTATGPYEPGELAPFLHRDAFAFLMDKGNSAMIVTALSKSDDHMVMSALHGIPRTSVMYTEGKLKGEHLAPYISMYGQSPIFIDDSVSQLESMERHCPGVVLYEMRRDGAAGSGRWPVIRTLAELP